MEDQIYGFVGAALSAVLTGGAAYVKARTDKVAQTDTAVALAQSKLAQFITEELRVCHEQNAAIRDELDRRSVQRDREREEHRAALNAILQRLDDCERQWRQHDEE